MERNSIQAFVDRGAEAWEAIPDPLIVFDEHSEIVFANSPARRFLMDHCLPLDRALIQTNIEVCDSANGAPLLPAALPLARALRGELTDNRQYQVRLVTYGRSLHVETSARPLYHRDGRIHGALIVFHEIEPRRESAGTMREFVYQGNLQGVAHSTIDGRILDCNEALVRMLGFSSADDLRATPAADLYFDASQREALIRSVIATNTVQEAEICLRRRDDSR